MTWRSELQVQTARFTPEQWSACLVLASSNATLLRSTGASESAALAALHVKIAELQSFVANLRDSAEHDRQLALCAVTARNGCTP